MAGSLSSSRFENDSLPALTEKPIAYPGCCLALSSSLLLHLNSLLPPPPEIVLSIGSGFGLLESYLLATPFTHHIIGVEVEPSPNRYLPVSNHRTVDGTRFLDPLAGQATVWLFVYPRRVDLVNEYLSMYGDDSVKQIIWIGPQADWNQYQDCFTRNHVETRDASQVGGRPWDMIAVIKMRP
ncbi:hypothetical protein GQ44DRAFT_685071 [Phaeosphaeriaceae sp. PMI808]|nr:hypothetical protein GQ44DRAFT_685071 [Phaeosphaeriaceae sp. PMI808]